MIHTTVRWTKAEFKRHLGYLIDIENPRLVFSKKNIPEIQKRIDAAGIAFKIKDMFYREGATLFDVKVTVSDAEEMMIKLSDTPAPWDKNLKEIELGDELIYTNGKNWKLTCWYHHHVVTRIQDGKVYCNFNHDTPVNHEKLWGRS